MKRVLSILGLSILIRISLFFLFITGLVQAQSVGPVVFVARNIQPNGNVFYPASSLLPGMGPFSRFKVVGGRLIIRESNGVIRVLVDSTMNFNGTHIVDVCSPCVFWDTSRIVFAGVEHPDSSWRIYEIHSDGTSFRKITYTNRPLNLSQFGKIANMFIRYDDIDPCYLPDGRICFASDHYPSLTEYYGERTTNLYIMNPDGTDIHRITSERNGAEKPTIDPQTGKIVYARYWFNFDRPSRFTWNGLTRDSALAMNNDQSNIWEAATIRPDGDGLGLYAGAANNKKGLSSYRPRVMSNGNLLSVFVPNTPMDYTSGSTGIRWFTQNSTYENYVVGVNQDNMQLYVQNPPSIGTMQPPYATDPVPIGTTKILFSYATQVENQDYALYTINLDGTGLQLLYDTPGKMDLNAELLQQRPVPPVVFDPNYPESDELPPTIDPNTYFKNGGFRFDCTNMFTNGDVDQYMPDAPPITKNATLHFFLNFQRMNAQGLDTAIFLTQTPVQYSGQLNFDFAPADVSMFEQVVDSTNKVIANSTNQTAHVLGLNYGRTGIGTKCVGCHAGHTTIKMPYTISEGQFFNTSTSAHVTQSSFIYISDSLQYPGKRVVDRKARNDTLTVNWIANGTVNEYVELNWDVPIDIRRVILYNIFTNPVTNTNISVTDCEIFLYYQNIEAGHIASTGIIANDGTTITIPQITKIDRMRVIVKSFTGLINGQSHAGLAEVEANARVSYYEETIGIKQISSVADRFSLTQNFPNPFNPATKIRYSIPKVGESPASNVKLTVFDITGRLVATLVNQLQAPGSYETEFDATNFASGIYFYRLTAGSDFTEVKKMVLLK